MSWIKSILAAILLGCLAIIVGGLVEIELIRLIVRIVELIGG